MTSTNDTRKAFLDFFAKHSHAVLPSSPLVPQNDPSLMFTNAGMVQFKNVFTGHEKLSAARAATSQKCVRAGGKHNDLDNVGYTARHHTFFEMLGNFSFGDYFKEDAIALAWELLTKDFALPPEKLLVTVYHTDDEAFSIWKKVSGFRDGKIIRIPTADNFWSMGDTGPCGPCSEIFYDHGESVPGGPPGSADADGDRFTEIWNLVFMQFDQLPDGTRVPLPKPSIDTGMGLERIAAVLQGKHDNYDTDQFKKLISAIDEISRDLGATTQGAHLRQTLENTYDRIQQMGVPTNTAHRVIADHLRASCFLIADGVLPSNEGRGYVLRRIMRRAMRYAHQLGCKDPLMHRLVPALVTEMGDAYPELKRAQASIESNLSQEEERFRETLARGLKLLEEEIEKLPLSSRHPLPNPPPPAREGSEPRRSEGGRAGGGGSNGAAVTGEGAILPGDVAFKLYDTYGFPLDLTQDILRARGMSVDEEAFRQAMEQQKDMARAAWSGSGEKAVAAQWFRVKDKAGATRFLGYEEVTNDATVLALVRGDMETAELQEGDEAYLVADQTPFYGESGGQIGDTGIVARDGVKIADVIDTAKPVEDFILHKIRVTGGSLAVGDQVTLAVDHARRDRIRANHSATHLLHAALRKILGKHIAQKGSLVAHDRLRFDFSHGQAIPRAELDAIEREVNRLIWQNSEARIEEMTPQQAQEKGAMALFGEKYGEKVRVLSMGWEEHPHPIHSKSSAFHAEPLLIPPAGERSCAIAQRYAADKIGGAQATTSDSDALGASTLSMPASSRTVAEAARRQDAKRPSADQILPYSIELCGGTHVRRTGDIGLFKIVSESAVAAGVRRIEALTRDDAFAYLSAQDTRLRELANAVKVPLEKLPERVEALQASVKKLEKELAEAKRQLAMGGSGAQEDAAPERIGDIQFIGKIFRDLNPKDLRPLAEQLLKKLGESGVVAVASDFEGKASIVTAVAKPLSEKVSAIRLVQAAVEVLGGKGGGGRPEIAQGGGPEAGTLEEALRAIKENLR